MSEADKVNKELAAVAGYFTADEWAIMFNAIGEIPIKMNSKEHGVFIGLRGKIKTVHDKATEIEPKGA